MHAYRTHTCGALRLADASQTARLSGWVHRKRDHGQLLFVDLRDHYGITQCVIDVSSPLFPAAEALRLESVVTMTGRVTKRTEDTINPSLPTGEVELVIDAIDVQSVAEPLPFPVNTDAEYPEDMRLTYRFLDLRREDIHAKMMLRSAVIASIRRRMIEQGFNEFQTPILTADSPEGARPYLVPSRIDPGAVSAHHLCRCRPQIRHGQAGSQKPAGHRRCVGGVRRLELPRLQAHRRERWRCPGHSSARLGIAAALLLPGPDGCLGESGD